MTAKRKLMQLKWILKHDIVQKGKKSKWENVCKKRGRLSGTRKESLLEINRYLGEKMPQATWRNKITGLRTAIS